MSYVFIKCETINFITECEDITRISSPFENSENDHKKICRILKGLDNMLLVKKDSEYYTREVIYQIHINTKSGHTEKIISYGERLLHYYDGQCLGEYYVPVITRAYLYYMYGSVR